MWQYNFLCSHIWLQVISQHCLPIGTVDMEELTWQKLNLDHCAGNEVDGLPSANNVIQLSVKSSGKLNLDHGAGNEVDGLPSAKNVIQLSVKSSGEHKISACWLLRRESFVSMKKTKWWSCRLLACDNVYSGENLLTFRSTLLHPFYDDRHRCFLRNVGKV